MDWEFEDLEGLDREELASRLEEVLEAQRALLAEEPEEELSLDTLLQSTQEVQELEDIEGEQKSDERLLIERFVDENPEAVANLLRNWLQEEW